MDDLNRAKAPTKPAIWRGLELAGVRALLEGLAVRWWIAGGWAIDLFVGRKTREHADTDVLILRPDQLAVQAHLAGWELYAADPPGQLRPWRDGGYLPVGIHDIWCRRGPDEPWSLQLMVAEVEGDRWVFRRDARIQRGLETIGRRSGDGTPYLTPEIQLLFKSKGARPKDQADFEAALPRLEPAMREWLAIALRQVYPSGHPWPAVLAD